MGRNALVGALLVLLVAAVCALLVVAGAFVIALNEATGWSPPRVEWSPPRVLTVLTYWVVGGTLSLVGFVLSGILAKSRIGEAVCVGLIAAGIVGLFFLIRSYGIDQNGVVGEVVGEAVGSLTIIALVVGLLGIAFRDGGFGLLFKKALIYGSLAIVVGMVAIVLVNWQPSWLPSWLQISVKVVLWIVAGCCFLAGVITVDALRESRNVDVGAVCFWLIAVGVVSLFVGFLTGDGDSAHFPNGVVHAIALIMGADAVGIVVVWLLLALIDSRPVGGSWSGW